MDRERERKARLVISCHVLYSNMSCNTTHTFPMFVHCWLEVISNVFYPIFLGEGRGEVLNCVYKVLDLNWPSMTVEFHTKNNLVNVRVDMRTPHIQGTSSWVCLYHLLSPSLLEGFSGWKLKYISCEIGCNDQATYILKVK